MDDLEWNLKRAFRNQGNCEARSSDSLVPVVTFRYKSCEWKSRLKDYSLTRQAKGPQEEIASGMGQRMRRRKYRTSIDLEINHYGRILSLLKVHSYTALVCDQEKENMSGVRHSHRIQYYDNVRLSWVDTN